LVVGLLVILTTAWVQSLPQTTAAEEAGEVPTDWQVAPSDVVASLKAGRLPHLTWGRAIIGGVMAMSLLFCAAGVFVLVTGGDSFLGPQEAGAELAASSFSRRLGRSGRIRGGLGMRRWSTSNANCGGCPRVSSMSMRGWPQCGRRWGPWVSTMRAMRKGRT